jgi:hypothetical protein
MEVLAFMIVVGLIALVLTQNFGEEETLPKVQQPAQQQPVQFAKVTEATENATEFPDGTIVSVRNVRQWH